MIFYLLFLIPLPYLLFKLMDVYTSMSSLSEISNENIFVTLYKSIKTYIKSKLHRNTNTVSLEKKHGNVYEIKSIIEGKECNIFIKLKKGPQKHIVFHDETGKNINHIITKYTKHFTLLPLTPNLLGFSTVTKNTDKTFTQHDHIENE